jgi:hypothetical protein
VLTPHNLPLSRVARWRNYALDYFSDTKRDDPQRTLLAALIAAVEAN